jgi:hypothetical protein
VATIDSSGAPNPHRYNPRVADSDKTSNPDSRAPLRAQNSNPDKVLCERCGAEMFRMHAVWRCPGCGYKTDCCGW